MTRYVTRAMRLWSVKQEAGLASESDTKDGKVRAVQLEIAEAKNALHLASFNNDRHGKQDKM